MRITSAIAIYFIIWWLVLFISLPFGVKNADEAGEKVEPGHEAGAPVKPAMRRRVIYNTILATVVFALVYAMITQHWLTLDSFPRFGEP